MSPYCLSNSSHWRTTVSPPVVWCWGILGVPKTGRYLQALICMSTLRLYSPPGSMPTYYIMYWMPLSMPLPLFVEQGEPRRRLQPFLRLWSPLTLRCWCRSYVREVPAAVPGLPSMDSGAGESKMLVPLVGSKWGGSAMVFPLSRVNNYKTQLKYSRPCHPTVYHGRLEGLPPSRSQHYSTPVKP